MALLLEESQCGSAVGGVMTAFGPYAAEDAGADDMAGALCTKGLELAALSVA